MASYKKNTRMCYACRQHADKSELVRFVRTDGGEYVPDGTGKAQGRGMWAHNSAECIAKLKKRKLIPASYEIQGDTEAE